MKSVNWFILVCLAIVGTMANGCLMGDEGNPTAVTPATGGTSAGGASTGGTTGVCVDKSTEICQECPAGSIDGERTCTNGAWGACKDCVATQCTPGQKDIGDCSPTMVKGSRTCTAEGNWPTTFTDCKNADVDGDGHNATVYGGDDCNDNDASVHPGAVDKCGDGVDQDCSGADAVCSGCNPGATQTCVDCPAGMTGGSQTCQSDRTWGACTCKSSGPVACANLTGITEWVDVTLTEATTETSVVQFQGICGNYNTTTKKWINVSDWTVVPTCEAVPVVNGVATCKTRRPKAYATVEANAKLNNTYWAIGVLTNTQALDVCPSSYNSSTQTCNDLWSVQRFHGTMTIGGTTCTASNAVVNGNNDSFNCRVTQ